MLKAYTSPSATTLFVTVVVAILPSVATAQGFVCDPIHFGDTAASMARKMTGRADSRHRPWFRIIDPATSTVVRKARYDRVRPGWRACVPVARLVRPAPVPTVSWGSAQLPPTPPPPPARHGMPVALAYLWCAAAAFGAAVGAGWQKVEQVHTKRRLLTREMQGFATLFVEDFERPLVADGRAARAIRARLRCAPARGRMDILLAPAAGRRYPNLDDHRHNVEYDVTRIAHRLRDDRFVRRPLRTEGQWIVIPFQFEPGPKAGAVV